MSCCGSNKLNKISENNIKDYKSTLKKENDIVKMILEAKITDNIKKEPIKDVRGLDTENSTRN